MSALPASSATGFGVCLYYLLNMLQPLAFSSADWCHHPLQDIAPAHVLNTTTCTRCSDPGRQSALPQTNGTRRPRYRATSAARTHGLTNIGLESGMNAARLRCWRSIA
jgi:hypothetical protein